MARAMVDASRVICIDLTSHDEQWMTHKKTGLCQERRFFLMQLVSTGVDANPFDFARGNALFPLGRAGDVGAGAT